MLISIQELQSFINQSITGILHVGAHDCEELQLYNSMNVQKENIIWIDAIEEKVKYAQTRNIPNVYHAVITDKDNDKVIFNISNNGQSSSVLNLKTHLVEYPQIFYVNKRIQSTMTIDTFFTRNQIDPSKYNFWNMDIQGAELMALKGSANSLQYVNFLYLEVNEKELYEKCGLIGEIDSFLYNYNFERKITKMTMSGWGDALYVRKI